MKLNIVRTTFDNLYQACDRNIRVVTRLFKQFWYRAVVTRLFNWSVLGCIFHYLKKWQIIARLDVWDRWMCFQYNVKLIFFLRELEYWYNPYTINQGNYIEFETNLLNKKSKCTYKILYYSILTLLIYKPILLKHDLYMNSPDLKLEMFVSIKLSHFWSKKYTTVYLMLNSFF